MSGPPFRSRRLPTSDEVFNGLRVTAGELAERTERQPSDSALPEEIGFIENCTRPLMRSLGDFNVALTSGRATPEDWRTLGRRLEEALAATYRAAPRGTFGAGLVVIDGVIDPPAGEEGGTGG